MTDHRVIPFLAAIYSFWTYNATAEASASALYMGTPDLNPHEMRRAQASLYGTPLRIRSIHLNALENFAGFAVAACLAQSINATDPEIVNLLFLHVFLKIAVYTPAYWFGSVRLRGFSHFLAMTASALVCWKLAVGGA